MSSSSLSPPIVLDRALDPSLIQQVVSRHLAPVLPSYLPRQRWYGDKDRTLRVATVIEVAAAPMDAEWCVLSLVEVEFADGAGPARYLTLLVLTDHSGAAAGETLLEIRTPGGDWRLTDVDRVPGFPAWWLAQFRGEAELAGYHGRFHWRRLAGFDRAATETGPGRLILGGMGQSNTTLRYAAALFGKIFRRIRAGINPDEEVSRFLVDHTSFRQLPIPYGSAFYLDDAGERHPVAVLFSFVPSIDDGWQWTQQFLTSATQTSYAGAARRLGERTGQLHLALSSVATVPDFVPEPATASDIDGWLQTVSANLQAVVGELDAIAPRLSPRVQEMISAVHAGEDRLRKRAAGFRALSRTFKTRIHGDYHLGQVLRTPDADWVLLDFEGEPARTIAQRRAKTSPVKDVADMLRSFSYARAVAAQADGGDAAALTAWEDEARGAFLAGYRAEISRSPVPLAPGDDVAFASAVAAFELAKAIYEVRYELGNRPDWLHVPLATLVGRQ